MTHQENPVPPEGDPLPPGDILTVEQEVLRALCQPAPGESGGLHEKHFRLLSQYRFRGPLHQVIFDTLHELHRRFPTNPEAPGESLKQHLASRLTRKGFPDVDLESFLQAGRINEEELQRCVLRLMGADKQATNREGKTNRA